MRTDLIVVRAPRFCDSLNFGKRCKDAWVEQLVPNPAVQRFDLGILRRLAELDEWRAFVTHEAPVKRSLLHPGIAASF